LYPSRFALDKTAQREFKHALKHLNQCNNDLEAQTGRLQARLDALAGGLQHNIFRLNVILYVVAFIAFSAQVINGPAMIKFATLALAYLGDLFARRFDYENRYQDYRALSEGLRVREATDCAGLPREFVETSYLGMQQSELQWIRMALRSAELIHADDASQDELANSHTCRAWAVAQRNWYQNAVHKQSRLAHRVTVAARAATASGVVLAALAFIYAFIQGDNTLVCLHESINRLGHTAAQSRGCVHWISMEKASRIMEYLSLTPNTAGRPNDAPTAPIAIGALLAVFFSSYAAKWGYAKNAKRYERMYLVFDRACKVLKNSAPGSATERALIHL